MTRIRHAPVCRIIPARAGFTRLTSWSRVRAWGSSPLARGLPLTPETTAEEVWIIPARAGFTPTRWSGRRRRRDHPRSRGVYLKPWTPPPPTAWIIPARAGFTEARPASSRPHQGSSPLARGLRGASLHECGPFGIIPARAGFTRGDDCPNRCTRDHPRSRGVYLRSTVRETRIRGSSPLARGLQGPNWIRAVTRGIIPARAGFTGPRWPGSPPTGDHPRSRGVYQPGRQSLSLGPGSSPLARGLPIWRRRTTHHPGIIPARAGFTGFRRGLRHRRRDHPRSRGVYTGRTTSSSSRQGSSPLARGLRDRAAGRPVAVRDHPRSRGVYTAPGRCAPGRGGSSPLARGLRGGAGPVAQAPGIIPARAGFTHTGGAGGLRRRDHPRSRGVYSISWCARGRSAGSSPLARGLPDPAPAPITHGGIIPARAGFTPGP